MIGAILIAVDVTRYFKGFPNEPIVQEDSETDDTYIMLHPQKTKEHLEWERTNRKANDLGIGCYTDRWRFSNMGKLD